MMIYGKNNVIVPIRKANGSPEEYAIFNPLSGSFDLMNREEYDWLSALKETGRTDPAHRKFYEYLLERGYLFADKTAEEARIIQEFAKFQAEVTGSQTQLLLIPSYGCNLACTYCYEQGVAGEAGLITKETVDAFFDYVGRNFTAPDKPKPFVTLFGGEPLINTPAHREMIRYIVDHAASFGYELAVVTNGYALAEYVEILNRAKIKEIQVTLDGSKAVHDKRRGTRNGKGSFDKIVSGIREAVQNRFPINLRTVVDQENLMDLVNLAEFLNDQGWLDLGPERFKTQIGRNYELFTCYAKPEHLLSQVELWAEFVKLSRDYPVLRKFHRPDFKGIRHLVDTGSLYFASFDTCPAAKREWVFDLHGAIYGCTASCGREEYRLGSYYPEVRLNSERIGEWQKRNVLTIPECRECPTNVLCGGGCGVIAANKTGRVLSPDCRPVRELIDLGINYYSDEILKMAGEGHDHTTGCRICGAELVYQEHSFQAHCEICGLQLDTSVSCKNGHYVCDGCHRGDILSRVERICRETELQDPVLLAQEIFRLPGLNMHGPEYHSIVPAIIVAAYENTIHNKRFGDIRTAIQRGKAIPGGTSGSHGACGAAIGLGIAYSILNQVTPLSRESRGQANRLTAAALTAIAKYDGPRCCKREAVGVLETAKQFLPGFNGLPQSSYVCSQFSKNKGCLGERCPYFPVRDQEEAECEACCQSRKDDFQ
ncbi:MAG TPA: DUF5714 domain-containing protein [Bacillota bacterium]